MKRLYRTVYVVERPEQLGRKDRLSLCMPPRFSFFFMSLEQNKKIGLSQEWLGCGQILVYKARVFSTSCLTRPEIQGGQHGVDRNWEHSVSVHMQHQSLPARDRWRQWAGTGPRLTHEGYMAQSIGPHNVMNTGDC